MNFSLSMVPYLSIPVKALLQDLARKGPFSCTPARSCKILQDPAGSCGILWDFAEILQEFRARILQDSCKIPQDPAGSCNILQDLAGVQEKRTFSCKILQERFYWDIKTGLKYTQGLKYVPDSGAELKKQMPWPV